MKPPRIWVFQCAFTKQGVPNLGNFGSSIQPVVIIPLAAWQKLCADIPALAATEFEVGTK
jgi:hypothetical protein